MSSHILRLTRTDSPDEHLLLNVTQTSKAKPLNIKLTATDHDHLYHATLKDSTLKSLQASNYTGHLDEWKHILSRCLLHQPTDHSITPPELQGLETVAGISGTTATLTLRKNISGITQRLGTIKLEQDDEREEVSAFDWVETAVAHSDELRSKLHTLHTSLTEHQQQVSKLTAQLDDLVKAKKKHEDELLKKFAALLNSKKLKIRDQQRLLADAKLDPATACSVRDAPRSATSSTSSRGGVGASRKGKRKANTTLTAAEVAEAEADPEAAAEEEDEGPDDELRLQEETPQKSDRDATEDEESDGEGARPALEEMEMGKKGRALDVAKEDKEEEGKMEVEDVPPKRELPFLRKASSRDKGEEAARVPARSSANAHDDEDEDDETDDEL